jgi:hypothetical protein
MEQSEPELGAHRKQSSPPFELLITAYTIIAEHFYLMTKNETK